MCCVCGLVTVLLCTTSGPQQRLYFVGSSELISTTERMYTTKTSTEDMI